MNEFEKFSADQIEAVSSAVKMAEELVSDFYKMTTSQWLKGKFDVKTLADLSPSEIVHGPLAQVIRYEGQRKDGSLSSSAYDFYKICLQDHSILSTIRDSLSIKLLPFLLYIISHELIHIVRFSKFLQNFDASPEEKILEEARVHEKTRVILSAINVPGIENVLTFYNQWPTLDTG